ncbi:autotransporter outer membrane beta-barrel domain-containing protein [Pseudomonas gingeri]|nr:autotransporter outer membrane beta-barrel domain-containing protein [Pseudomonas gingeri]
MFTFKRFKQCTHARPDLLCVFLMFSSSWAYAQTDIIENGASSTIDASSPVNGYILRTNGTLNVNGGSTQQIQADSSNLNIDTGNTWQIAATNGSILNISGATITAAPGIGYGVSLLDSHGTFTDTTITSTDGTGLTLLQGGQNSGGSTAVVSNSTITGLTSGISASSLSTVQLTNTHVEGTGATSSGMLLFSADATATGSTIVGGQNGITIVGNGTFPRTSTVSLSGTHVEGGTGSAIVVAGVGPTETNIEVLNGSTLTGGNGTMLDVSGGATANMLVGNSALTGNVDVTGNSTANLSFNQGSMVGDFNVESGSTGNLALANGSLFKGSLTNVDGVTINSGSQWEMTASNSVGTLAMDNGTVTMGQGNNFYQLDVGTLAGNGTFAMNVDFATNQHDVLNVTGASSGDFKLLVAGSGVDPVSPEALTLVHTAAGNASFALAGAGLVDVGTYSYGLGSSSNGSGGTDWFLDPNNKTISPSTQSVLALFNTAPTVWYGELTSLRTRMGELRFNDGQSGSWARAYGNKYNVSESSGVGYSQNQQGFTLGADAPLKMGDGHWLIGAMAGHSNSDLDLKGGTTGNVKSYYVGGYTTWLEPETGYYFDGVVKLNRFENESKVAMSDGTQSKGNYGNTGLGGSAEFGRHIKLDNDFFVEPFGQLSAVVIQGKNYNLDNGLQAEGDQTRSFLGKVGTTVGRNLTLESGTVVQPYLKAAVAHEFAKNNDVKVNNTVFNNDLSGSRAEFGAGVAVKLSKDLQVHADFDYANGKSIEQPFGANVGLRYSW